MMTYNTIEWTDLSVTVRIAKFCVAGGASEFHAAIEFNNVFANTETQYQLLEEASLRLTESFRAEGCCLVWKRFFVSDAINHAGYLKTTESEALSVVQQPPLNGSKASMLLYFVENVQLITEVDNIVVMKRPYYEHLFHTQQHERAGNTTYQTQNIFDRYCNSLSQRGCLLAKNCIRTWIFVQNVDIEYTKMVVARREHFEREGLTPQTHFIASTGIEGRYIYPDVQVFMDTYALVNIQPEQIHYLHAPTHLNPTHEYGVTFERGATVDYGDRRHVFISGTASINNKGEIVYPFDVEKQTARTFENVQTLLAEAGATMQHVAHIVIYLRDIADYAVTNRYVAQHYPDIPRVMLWAPVCRPGWLVEIECMAIIQAENKQYVKF